MTAVSDRIAVKALAVSTLSAAFAATEGDDPDLSNVTVHYGDPGEGITDNFVALGRIEGTRDPEAFGPAGQDDTYTIACLIDVAGYATEQEADERAQDVLNALNVALFQSNFARAYNAAVYPAKQDGPNGWPAGIDNTPAGSQVELDIAVSVSVRGI